ncbi:MAG: hypothetical protein Q9191_006307 [Dirinaria sp. TL-2023a]
MPRQPQHYHGPFANGGDSRTNFVYPPQYANHQGHRPYGPNGQYHHDYPMQSSPYSQHPGYPLQSSQYYQPHGPSMQSSQHYQPHGPSMQSSQYYQSESRNPHYPRNVDTDFLEQHGQPLTFNEQPTRADSPDFDLQLYRRETPVPVGHRHGERWRRPAERRFNEDLTVVIQKVMAGELDPKDSEAYGAFQQYAACKKIEFTKDKAIEQLQDMLRWEQQRQQQGANMQSDDPYVQGDQAGYRAFHRQYK